MEKLKKNDILESPILNSCLNSLRKLNKRLTIEEYDMLLYELLKDYYIEEPVPIYDFLNDSYYLGEFGKSLFPVWKEKLYQLYKSRFVSPYYMILLQACIGAGKSTILGAIAEYELHKNLCLKNPALFYGLSSADVLYFLFYTCKRKIAEDGNFIQFKNMLKGSDYFKEHLMEIPETPYAGQLTPNLAVRVVSMDNDLVSKAVIFAGLDEFNEKKHKTSSNTNIYHSMLRRMDSRLKDSYGNNPYKLVIASSPKDESDELGRVVETIKQNKLEHNCMLVEGITAMDTSGLRLNYSGEKFNVYIDGSNSYVMNDINDIRVADFDLDKTYKVPVEYKDSFIIDTIGAIREILGIRIGSTGRFFRDENLIINTFTKKNLTPDTLMLPFNISLEDGIDRLYEVFSKEWTFPDCPRTIHIDTALRNDRLGLSASFITPVQANMEVESFIKEDTFRNLMFINDFSIGIESMDGQEIPLDVIISTLIRLKDDGYPIYIVTYDSFNSASIHQPLERRGINNEYLSVDTSKEPYMLLKRAMLAGNYLGTDNKIAIKEAKDLLNLPKKIDHPSDSSKDIMDAVCGSFFSCYKYMDDILSRNYTNNNQAVKVNNQLLRAGFRRI